MAKEFSFDSPSVLTNADIAELNAEVFGTPGAAKSETAAAPQATAQPKQETASAATSAGQEPSAVAQPKEETTQPAEEEVKTEEPAESKTYKVKVGNEEFIVTEKDLLDGHMRYRDYTQKTQRLADERRQFEGRIVEQDNTLAQLDQFLRDKAAVEAYYNKVFGTSLSTPAPAATPTEAGDPNELISQAQARQLAEQLSGQRVHEAEQRLQAQFERRLLEQEAKLERKALSQTYEIEVERHMQGILDKFPVLKKFENIEEELLADAGKYKPRSLEEAKEQLVRAAERRSAIIKAEVAEEAKRAAAQAAKLRKTGTEPPGGTGVKPAPGKDLSMSLKDRNALLAVVEEDFRQALNPRD